MSDKKKSTRALANLVPNAIRVMVEGSEVFVASNREENSMLNMVVAARMRSLLEETMRNYKEKGVMMTPKELKDFTESARNISEFSDAIYAGSDGLAGEPKDKGEKNVTASDTIEAINFDSLKKPNANQDLQPNQPPSN
jgi:hypothetical protein